MKSSVTLWIIAFVMTLAIAVYQRVTGPTHPVKESITLNGLEVKAKFDRSHSGEGDQPVIVETNSNFLEGDLYWKRYKTSDDWNIVKMKKEEKTLAAFLPHQPPAGKLEYFVKIVSENSEAFLPAKPIVTRFKGAVPDFILIPHIIFMFAAMLLALRTAMEIFKKQSKFKVLTTVTVIVLGIGGMILGPVVQKYAFGEFWTGFPNGTDLTDNKTLIAFIGWLIALAAVIKDKKPKYWIAFATILMFAIFLIPHSVMGSELDYNKLDKEKNNIEQMNEPSN
jgi:hypothetical protein